jgi:hypothetical protein
MEKVYDTFSPKNLHNVFVAVAAATQQQAFGLRPDKHCQAVSRVELMVQQ